MADPGAEVRCWDCGGYCVRCGIEVVGRPIELRPPDPQMVLCRPCGTPPDGSATGGTGGVLSRTVLSLDDEVERLRRGMHDIYGLSGSLEDARAIAKAHIEATPFGGAADRD